MIMETAGNPYFPHIGSYWLILQTTRQYNVTALMMLHNKNSYIETISRSLYVYIPKKNLTPLFDMAVSSRQEAGNVDLCIWIPIAHSCWNHDLVLLSYYDICIFAKYWTHSWQTHSTTYHKVFRIFNHWLLHYCKKNCMCSLHFQIHLCQDDLRTVRTQIIYWVLFWVSIPCCHLTRLIV